MGSDLPTIESSKSNFSDLWSFPVKSSMWNYAKSSWKWNTFDFFHGNIASPHDLNAPPAWNHPSQGWKSDDRVNQSVLFEPYFFSKANTNGDSGADTSWHMILMPVTTGRLSSRPVNAHRPKGQWGGGGGECLFAPRTDSLICVPLPDLPPRSWIAASWRWIWSIRSINRDYCNPRGQKEGIGPLRVHASHTQAPGPNLRRNGKRAASRNGDLMHRTALKCSPGWVLDHS